MNKKVAVIMINYKYYAKRFLKESYNSLVQLNYPKENYRIYIVDNVTTSKTVELCKKLAPEAVIVPSKGNGWGHANNVGAQKAIEQGFDDYFFFVNMDTEFNPNFITEAIKTIESDKNIGIVQSKLLLSPPVNGEYMLNSKGNTVTFLGFGYCAGDGKKDDTNEKNINIVSAAGAGLLISKELFLKAGKCDESYFMYHDDIELSFKIKLMGYRLVLAPKSIVYHKHEFGRAIMQIYYMERNRLRFLLEFYKIKTLLIIFPALLFMEIGMIFYEIKNKWFLTKLKVYIYFLNPKNLFQIWKKRKFIQNLRKIDDKKMMQKMSGIIDFQQIENPVLKYIANPIFSLYWYLIKKIIIW